MYKDAKTLFMICQTPLHAGSGDSLSIVDLPIQRERHTSYPKIESSSLKGAIREFFHNSDKGKSHVNNLFGDEDGEKQAGSMTFTDARLLLFPVKSLKGIFAWITCPSVLEHFASVNGLTVNCPPLTDESRAIVMEGSPLVIGEDKIILEEYAFDADGYAIEVKNAKNKESVNNCIVKYLSNIIFKGQKYLKEKAATDIVIVSDNTFKDFVNLSTEVITRIKINSETGTVESGALFTEEFLPTESVLYSTVLARGEFRKQGEEVKEISNSTTNMTSFATTFPSDTLFQLGGGASLGKGILRTVLHPVVE